LVNFAGPKEFILFDAFHITVNWPPKRVRLPGLVLGQDDIRENDSIEADYEQFGSPEQNAPRTGADDA
jgi:hypothetical protein